MTTYPKRDRFHAHRVVRVMCKSCAMQDMGSTAFALVTVIAHQEDAKRYTGPVTFWNSQLLSILGTSSPATLDRARDKAIAAGWLHYEPGTKGKVGRYWTTIPPDLDELNDQPMDEGSTENVPESLPKENGIRKECRMKSTLPYQNGNDSGGEPEGIRRANGDHSTLSLALKERGGDAHARETPPPPQDLPERLKPIHAAGVEIDKDPVRWAEVTKGLTPEDVAEIIRDPVTPAWPSGFTPLREAWEDQRRAETARLLAAAERASRRAADVRRQEITTALHRVTDDMRSSFLASPLGKAWPAIIGNVRTTSNETAVKAWLEPARVLPMAVEDEALVLLVPSLLFQKTIQDRFSAQLATAATEVLGQTVQNVTCRTYADAPELIAQEATAAS